MSKRIYEIKPGGDDKVTVVLRKHACLRFEAPEGVKPGTGALAQARQAKANMHGMFGNHLKLPIYSVSEDGREIRLIEE